MLVKLVELHKPQGDRVFLDEIYVSSSAVTTIRSESNTTMLEEARGLGINQEVGFSQFSALAVRISLNTRPPKTTLLKEKNEHKKMLLRDAV